MGGIGVPLKRPMGEIALDFSGPQPEPIAVSRGPNGVEIQRFGKSHPPEASPPNATNRGRGAPGIRGVFGKPQKLRGARGSLLRGSFLATEPEIRREDQRHRILFRDHIRNQKRPFRTGVLNSASITFYDSRKSRGLQITPSLSMVVKAICLWKRDSCPSGIFRRIGGRGAPTSVSLAQSV